jgi:hypothetical protein
MVRVLTQVIDTMNKQVDTEPKEECEVGLVCTSSRVGDYSPVCLVDKKRRPQVSHWSVVRAEISNAT